MRYTVDMDLGPPPYQQAPSTSLPKKRFPYLTLIISIAMTILAICSGVLGYENLRLQKQVKELQMKQVAPLPSPTPTQVPPTPPLETPKMCGGIAGIKCPTGFVCQMNAMYPDASGTCTKKEDMYTCPENGYVDCMPSPNAGIRFECTSEAMSWYKANCTNFKGGAL